MVDSHFGHWFAGFVDGEGCFYITSHGKSRPGVLRPRFSLTLRADDCDILEEIQRRTRAGSIHKYQPSGPGNLVARWMVQSQSDLMALCRIFDCYPLRSKKARDFGPWRRAVEAAAELRKGRGNNEEIYAVISKCDEELRKGRLYA
jgi:hypothetical protein